MEYYVNSINNISGLPENEEFLAFTPIGNARVYDIPNMFDRPIPSTLQTTPSIYTPKYLTSPFLGASNNINVLDTDNDLTLFFDHSIQNSIEPVSQSLGYTERAINKIFDKYILDSI